MFVPICANNVAAKYEVSLKTRGQPGHPDDVYVIETNQRDELSIPFSVTPPVVY